MRSTITVGIPAYNEEANITYLLDDLHDQKLSRNYYLQKILIVSDGSSDGTVRKVKSIEWDKVDVIAGRKNIGKAARLNQIITNTESNILVLLDADVRISDKMFLERIVNPIKKENAEMTSSAIRENIPRSSFEKALSISMQLKNVLFCNFKSGNNIYNCHGPARAFEKKLYKQLHFLTDAGDDIYSYLQCINLGMHFKYVDSTFITYRLPATKKEHFAQSWRYNWSKKYYIEEFSNVSVKKELKIPLTVFLKASILSVPILIRNLDDTFNYLVLWLESLINNLKRIDVSATWGMGSTKEVSDNAI